MDSEWSFRPLTPTSTEVEFRIVFDVSSTVLAGAIGTFLEDAANQQLQAFTARCHALAVQRTQAAQAARVARNERLAKIEVVLREHDLDCGSGESAPGMTEERFVSACAALAREVDGAGFQELHEQAALRGAVFVALDTFHRNGGTPRPLGVVARCLYTMVQAPRKERVKLIFELIDIDGDGELDFPELTNGLELHMQCVARAARHLVRVQASEAENDAAALSRALATVDTLMADVQSEIPLAVKQIFDDANLHHSQSISFAEWKRECATHPELLQMMSVRGMVQVASAAMTAKPGL